MKFLLLMLSFLCGCGSQDRSELKETHTPTEELEARYFLYKQLAPRGWDVSGGCDALLLVSLHQVGLGEMGPVTEAQSEPGRWHRLPGPDYARSCSADISRDMFIGLFTWIWQNKRLDLAEQIWDYGVRNNWKMGDERKDLDNRTVFLPGTIAVLADLIHGLGGQDHPERRIPRVYNTAPGFVSHLTLVQLHLRGLIYEGLSEYELDTLKTIRTHMSLNPLVHAIIHRYTDGDQTEATRLLLEIWPADRLPSEADWHEAWRLQRSDGDSGLLPGSGSTPHSGGDFLFPASIVMGLVG